MSDAEKVAFVKEQATEMWKLANQALSDFNNCGRDEDSVAMPESVHHFVEMGLSRITELAGKL